MIGGLGTLLLVRVSNRGTSSAGSLHTGFGLRPVRSYDP